VLKWFKDHRKICFNTPYVDPRSKFGFMGLDFKNCDIWTKTFCTIGDNITNAKISFKNRLTGVVKRFYNYEFFTEGYSLKLKVQQVNFSKINLFEYLKTVNSENFREKGIPLPITEVSKIVGVFKGSLPFKVDNRDYHEDNYVKNALKDEIIYDLNFLNNKQVYPGNWKYSKENLIDMCTPKDKFYNCTDLINGIFSRVGIDFKLPYIRYWNIEMVNGILSKGKAFPGILTWKLLGKTRKATTGFSKAFAKEYFLYVIKRYKQVFDMSLMTVGGREKRVKSQDKFKRLKTRVILMMEDVPTILGQSVAVPLTKAFQRLNEGYNFIGRSLEQRNYVTIMDELSRDPRKTIVFNADFSGHDNHVDEHQIVTAFGVLRLCFPEQWKFMDKLFYYFLSGMLCKHIVVPGSQFVYRVTKGIATGNPFTSLVNTTVAYMTFATALNKVCSYEELLETRLFVAGDDVIGVIPLSVLEKLSFEISNNSGMKIDPIINHCGPLISNDINYQRSFLKKKFSYLGVSWNDLELLDNLYTSASGVKNTSFEINRIINTLMNGPCDPQLNSRIFKIVKYHMHKPRINGISYYNPPPGLHSLPVTEGGLKYLMRDPKALYSDIIIKHITNTYNNRMHLAFCWFNTGQPFPALGYKDESYWIDATKDLIPCHSNAPYYSRLRLRLYKHFGVKWHMY